MDIHLRKPNFNRQKRGKVPMSTQYDRFVEALEALCREHCVQLSVSEYDTLDVWELRGEDPPIYVSAIRDMTREETKKPI